MAAAPSALRQFLRRRIPGSNAGMRRGRPPANATADGIGVSICLPLPHPSRVSFPLAAPGDGDRAVRRNCRWHACGSGRPTRGTTVDRNVARLPGIALAPKPAQGQQQRGFASRQSEKSGRPKSVRSGHTNPVDPKRRLAAVFPCVALPQRGEAPMAPVGAGDTAEKVTDVDDAWWLGNRGIAHADTSRKPHPGSDVHEATTANSTGQGNFRERLRRRRDAPHRRSSCGVRGTCPACTATGPQGEPLRTKGGSNGSAAA
jgi:hypothetical protein